MKLICFVAHNATEALAEVHKRLGPDAVIVSVRQLPAPGWARLWSRKKRIEVTAGVPDKTSAPKSEFFGPPPTAHSPQSTAEPETEDSGQWTGNNHWRSVAWLEAMGLLPVHADRLQTHLRITRCDAPDSPEEEWEIVRTALTQLWLKPPLLDDPALAGRPHVFIGPPGSGKTTALCKWLTLATLLDGRSARVWRLDGSTANTAEFLAFHCEMLGVPLERFWKSEVRNQKSEGGSANPELWFVDLPGVEISDEAALTALREQLATLPSPRVHLVLNAAYETPALLAQWRAFAPCAPEDLIFTHFDEAQRRVKLWNFVFGTNCSVRFLGAGQKIPGEFRSASPELLLPAREKAQF